MHPSLNTFLMFLSKHNVIVKFWLDYHYHVFGTVVAYVQTKTSIIGWPNSWCQIKVFLHNQAMNLAEGAQKNGWLNFAFQLKLLCQFPRSVDVRETTLFANISSNKFYARKILKVQTVFLIVRYNVYNSISRNRNIEQTPSLPSSRLTYTNGCLF